MRADLGLHRASWFDGYNNLAQGHWVHILHHDDIVLPGFYDLLRKVVECSDAGAVFCRHAVVNLKGHWIQLSELHRESPGLLDD